MVLSDDFWDLGVLGFDMTAESKHTSYFEVTVASVIGSGGYWAFDVTRQQLEIYSISSQLSLVGGGA